MKIQNICYVFITFNNHRYFLKDQINVPFTLESHTTQVCNLSECDDENVKNNNYLITCVKKLWQARNREILMLSQNVGNFVAFPFALSTSAQWKRLLAGRRKFTIRKTVSRLRIVKSRVGDKSDGLSPLNSTARWRVVDDPGGLCNRFSAGRKCFLGQVVNWKLIKENLKHLGIFRHFFLNFKPFWFTF